MKILVAVKAVPQLSPLQQDPLNITKWVLDPFSEVALEQALQWCEQQIANEVIAISVGSSDAALRSALALGANRAVQISGDGNNCALVAKAIAEYAEQQQIDLLLLGKQSSDGDNHQVAQRTAAHLGWPQLSAIDQLHYQQGQIIASGLCAGGRGQYVVQPPLVISADLRLAAPRFAALPKLMKARRATLESFVPTLTKQSVAEVKLLAQQATVIQRKGIELQQLSELAALITQGGQR